MKGMRSLHPAWVAGAIAAGVCLWLVTGLFKDAPQAETEKEAPPERKIVKVQVIDSQAQELVREERVNARTAPLRSVILRAEVDGRIAAINAERGDRVKKGDVIARIAVKDRETQVRMARAMLDQRKLQYDAAKQLAAQGHLSQLDLATARTNYLTAESELKRANDALANTRIQAPFDGILETREIELGEYVNPGETVGRVIQNDPFLVRAQVTEDVISYLEVGQSGRVILPDGSERKGVLRYVASQADEATRTFPIELQLPNPDGELAAGRSVVLALPLEIRHAHELEPAVLALDENGEFGIKTVNAEGIVEFHKAEIVQNENGKVWLANLPDALRVIRVGQGFVATGQKVEPVTQPVD